MTLRRKQLEELDNASRLAFSLELQVRLQDVCTDYLINTEFERQAVLASAATSVYESLIAELGVVITSLAHIVGKETAQHHEVHVELDDQIQALSPGDTVNVVFRRLMNFQHAAVQARDEHLSHFGGPGRPIENESLRALIWELANLFEVAGGQAGVTYRPIDNRLQSPFLAWVKKLNGFLPKRIQVKATALPDLVREVCRARNKKKQKKKSVPKRSAK